MSIFVSWSGEANRPVGRALRRFVSEVLGTDDVFMSDEDIAPGDKSLEEIDAALKRSSAALVVVSARSARDPWLNFEAGAMGVRLKKTSVIPILLDLDFSQLIQPLAQFQAIRFDDEEKFRRMLGVLNSQRGAERIKSETLGIVFDSQWSSFIEEVSDSVSASAAPDDAAELPTDDEKLDEILSTVRRLTSATRRDNQEQTQRLNDASENHRELTHAMHGELRRLLRPTNAQSRLDSDGMFRVEIDCGAVSDPVLMRVVEIAKHYGAEIVIRTPTATHLFDAAGSGWSSS